MPTSMNLTSVSDLRACLEIGDSASDERLAAIVAAASARIEAHCHRSFLLLERTEYHDGRGSAWLVLRERPISAVADLREDLNRNFDAVIPIPVDGYCFYPEEGIIRLLRRSFAAGNRNVRVRYRAGYAPDAIPQDLSHACLRLAAHWFTISEAERTGAPITRNDWCLGTWDSQPIPAEVERMISIYRNWDDLGGRYERTAF